MQMPVPFHATFVVEVGREECLGTCRDALAGTPGFSEVTASDELFQINAKYRRPPVWGSLTVSLLAEGAHATRISATAHVIPNLFSFITGPERRILEHFTHAIRWTAIGAGRVTHPS
jgi:hypothetical protein